MLVTIITFKVPGEGTLFIHEDREDPFAPFQVSHLNRQLGNFVIQHGVDQGKGEDCGSCIKIQWICEKRCVLLCPKCGLRISLPRTAADKLSEFVLLSQKEGWRRVQSVFTDRQFGEFLAGIGRG